MAWEIRNSTDLRCESCGRMGKEINRENDWNQHETIFLDFDTRYGGRARAGEPNQGAIEYPVCPTCGPEAKVIRLPATPQS